MFIVKNLSIFLKQQNARIAIVKNISFSLASGGSLGVVGESGCGKSLLCHSFLGLLASKTFDVTGEIYFNDQNLLQMTSKDILNIRGKTIGMIFQDPMTSLNPVVKVGKQIAEPLQIHTSLSSREIKKTTYEMIEKVRLKDPEAVYNKYPFELSGGMQQRVMIAQALITKPALLIADEPTTALDVTVQAEILKLIKDLQSELEMSLVLVSHNFNMVSHFCDDMMVMYAGQVAEKLPTRLFYQNNAHPYTKALLASIPKIGHQDQTIESLPGIVPLPTEYPSHCRFSTRCPSAMPECDSKKTFVYQKNQHTVACNLMSGD